MPASLILPVILSGGAGTRLWPLSRPERPKQFLKLLGDETLLQSTLRRVATPDFLPPLIIGNEGHSADIDRQLSEIGIASASLILEPVARNTAPAIALAALAVHPDTPLLVMPSDHVIEDAEGFRSAVADALPLLDQAYLVTFGIAPTGPETGFGYIKAGAALTPSIARVDRFVEKPDAAAAAAYVAAGDYYWNGGIFLFRAGDFLAALAAHAPEIHSACGAAMERAVTHGNATVPDRSAFARSPAISVDYAVMEKAAQVAVAPVDIGWSDIGSWDALANLVESAGYTISEGPAVAEIGTRGCVIRTDGPVVAVIGVEDLIVVATDGAVLVVARGASQQVKQAVEILKDAAARPGSTPG